MSGTAITSKLNHSTALESLDILEVFDSSLNVQTLGKGTQRINAVKDYARLLMRNESVKNSPLSDKSYIFGSGISNDVPGGCFGLDPRGGTVRHCGDGRKFVGFLPILHFAESVLTITLVEFLSLCWRHCKMNGGMISIVQRIDMSITTDKMAFEELYFAISAYFDADIIYIPVSGNSALEKAKVEEDNSQIFMVGFLRLNPTVLIGEFNAYQPLNTYPPRDYTRPICVVFLSKDKPYLVTLERLVEKYSYKVLYTLDDTYESEIFDEVRGLVGGRLLPSVARKGLCFIVGNDDATLFGTTLTIMGFEVYAVGHIQTKPQSYEDLY